MPDPLIAELPNDYLREALQRAGYSVEEVADPAVATPYPRSARRERAAGIRPRLPRCSVTMQFGDEIATGADGVMCLTIRCRLRTSSEDDHLANVARWQIRQTFGAPDGRFAVEADLTLGSGIAPADILGNGRNVYRHLRQLLADGRETLDGLAIVDGPANGLAGPVLLIEAKFAGDIALGRSGLVGSRRSSISAGHKRLTIAACAVIRDSVLPDLACAVRAMIALAAPSVSSGQARLHRQIATPLLPDAPSAGRSNALAQAGTDDSLDNTSIVPGLEWVR